MKKYGDEKIVRKNFWKRLEKGHLVSKAGDMMSGSA